MIISFARNPPNFHHIVTNNTFIEQVEEFKILGVVLQKDLKWNSHASSMVEKANKRFLLTHLKNAGIPKRDLLTLYKSLVIHILNYSCEVFHSSLTQYLTDDIERVQKKALPIITGRP
jgi:hypothetical protein